MIDKLFDSFNLLNIYFISIVCILIYIYNKRKSRDQLNKTEEQSAIDSIPRRSGECPAHYPNGWLPVYDSNDLKKGVVKPVFALGRDLVVYRGISGKVYVFDAYCPHLGANLGVGGTVMGEDIQCPFHRWQFNNQGDCVAIPGLEDKSIPKATIRKWSCDEINGFIYVWHHLDEKEPDWYINKFEKLDHLVYRGTIYKRPYCHIQDIIENDADFTHFDYIHGTEALIPKLLQKIIKIKFIPKYWKPNDPPNTHCAQVQIESHLFIGSFNVTRGQFDIESTGPANLIFHVLLDMGFKLKLKFTFNIITLSQTKQLIAMKWYSEPSIMGLIFAKIMMRVIDYATDTDMPYWNGKRFLRKPKFTKLDQTVISSRRWYKQFYSDYMNTN